MILGHLMLGVLVGLLSGAVFIVMGYSLWTAMLFYSGLSGILCARP